MKIQNPYFLSAFIMLAVALSVGVRLMPHLPNFTPIGALALFVVGLGLGF